MKPPETFPVRILLFARYAELLGASTLTIELPAGSTVADAVGSVRRLPGGSLLPTQVLVARNLEQAPPQATLAQGDELAFLPPMSGG